MKQRFDIWEPKLRYNRYEFSMMVKQLIQFPNLYYAKTHFPLEISQRAFDNLWRMCESYELWCKEIGKTKLITLRVSD